MAEQPPISLDRLRAARDIRSVFASSRKRGGRYVVLHARDRGDTATARVAVIASRRVGTAVARNRAKRVMREAARHLVWRPGLDLVLVARGPAAEVKMHQVQDELREIAQRLDLLTEVRAA